VALLGLAAFRWMALLLHLDVVGTVAGELKPWRVLNASQTLYLAQALIITAYWRRHARGPAPMTWLLVALSAGVLLLQHRSVWVMTVAAIGLMAWREGFLGRFCKVAVTVALVIALVYPAVSTMGGDLADSFRSSVEEPLDMEQSTFGWRVAMWGEYLAEFAAMSPARMLLGAGLGSPSTYQIDGVEVDHSAHNYFVFVLNRAGILGLASLVGCYWMLVRRLRLGGVRWDYLGLFLMIASGQLVYYLVYSPAQDQGLLIGAALAAAFGRRAVYAG
jgi:hypothetical protein